MTDDVASILRRVDELSDEGRWRSAIELLEAERARRPDNISLLTSLAETYRFARRYDDARKALARARALSPDDRLVLLLFGVLHRDAAEIEEALEAHKRLAELYPTDGEAIHQYALTLTVLGKPDEALKMIEDVVRREPGDLQHQIVLGRTLIRLGRFRDAVRVLEAVVSADVDLLWGWLALAEAYYGQRRLPDWKRAVGRASALSPDHPAVLVQDSNLAFLVDGDLARALADCERALAVNPRWFAAYIARGVLAWNGKHLDLAEQALTQATQIAPWSGDALGVLAQFRGETGRGKVPLDVLEAKAMELPYGGLAGRLGRVCHDVFDDDERAVRLLEVAARCAPEDADTHYYLASSYHAVGRYEDTIRAATAAVRLLPNFGEAWIILGRACVMLDRYPEAAAALERGLERFPDDLLARACYAMALAGMGEKRRAITEYETALVLRPDEGSVLYNLASTLLDVGDLAQACSVAERARRHLPADDPDLAELQQRLDRAGS